MQSFNNSGCELIVPIDCEKQTSICALEKVGEKGLAMQLPLPSVFLGDAFNDGKIV